MTKIALYLAGGGARGSYQAGALKAIHEILNVKKIPFETITGVSVGSVNAAILAQHADDFALGIAKLEEVWADIHCEKIFSSSNYALSKSVLRNLSNTFVKQRQSGYLLSTDPLKQFINDSIKAWNLAPNELKNSVSIYGAKNAIKKFVKTIPI